MADKEKVKIVSTRYVEKSDLVELTLCIIEDQDTISLAIRGKELLAGWGITAECSPEQMRDFLDKMIGKEILWEIHKDNLKKPDLGEENQVLDMIEKMDDYPFLEVLQASEEHQ